MVSLKNFPRLRCHFGKLDLPRFGGQLRAWDQSIWSRALFAARSQFTLRKHRARRSPLFRDAAYGRSDHYGKVRIIAKARPRLMR
jgi:hypothetical protein